MQTFFRGCEDSWFLKWNDLVDDDTGNHNEVFEKWKNEHPVLYKKFKEGKKPQGDDKYDEINDTEKNNSNNSKKTKRDKNAMGRVLSQSRGVRRQSK